MNTDTAGNEILDRISIMTQCDCNSTGGCQKCNPLFNLLPCQKKMRKELNKKIKINRRKGFIKYI
jgi:hypothetical protein